MFGSLGDRRFHIRSSFPASLLISSPWQIRVLQLGIPAVIGWILFYKLGYALPMLLILGIYLMPGRNIDFDHDPA